MEFRLFRRYMLLLLGVALLTVSPLACTQNSDVVSKDDDKPVAVAFDTYLQQSQRTRANYPEGALDMMDNDGLRASGFGVFAQYTGDATFQHDAGQGLQPFNFMWNQKVTWSDGGSRWTYSPVKYWPNDNNPADRQTATGSQEHSYVSFFAYAPYVESSVLPASPADADCGIVAVTGSASASGTSALTYRLPASLKPSESVDLLWSEQPDRYKMDGGGYVDGTVKFQFIHALSKLTFVVRGVFDHVQPDDTEGPYLPTVDGNTKILVERVEIVSPEVYRQGDMMLAQESVDGSTARAEQVVPTWKNMDHKVSLSVEQVDINDDLLYQADPADADDADAALANFKALPAGVLNVDQSLWNATSEPYRLLIPAGEEQTLTVRVVYHVITYDERLTLNTPKYFSCVRNDIQQSATQTIVFEPNKIYTLRLLLGLTTVKFEVDVEDWAVPIMLNPVVRDPDVVTRELDVTE